MKRSSRLALLFGALTLSTTLASQVQAEMKVGTIDMQKVFNGYYKTRGAEDKLKEAQKAYKDELDTRMDSYKKNMDLINRLNEEMSRPDGSAASKDQKAQQRDSKIQETKGLEKEITDFRQTREKQIQEQLKRMRDQIVEDIMKIVNEQVKTQNYDFVFDKSGFSANNIVSVVLYAKDGYDFSESIISRLNASAPPVASSSNTPAAGTKPAGNPGTSPKP